MRPIPEKNETETDFIAKVSDFRIAKAIAGQLHREFNYDFEVSDKSFSEFAEIRVYSGLSQKKTRGCYRICKKTSSRVQTINARINDC